MKIHIRFYAQLRDLLATSQLDVDVPEGATVADLLIRVYQLKPKLRVHDQTILIGAGVDFIERAHVLRDGEEIAIMPPVQGG